MALAFTVLSYLALTCYDALALRYIGKRIQYWKIALASFAGYAFSNTLGLPLFTGTPLRARLYSGWGMTALDIARVVLFSYITFWLGFIGLSGTAFLLEPIAVRELLHLPMASARPVGVLFLSLIAAFLAMSFARQRPFVFKGVELAIPRPPMAAAQIAIASLDWAFAATVLYALLPSSWNITFVHFLGVFLFAQVAGLLSHVPGGLGVFETMMVLLMPRELPRAELLAAMVAFRGVYYFLPLLLAAVSLGAHEVVRRREQVGKIARIFGGRAPDVVTQILAVTTFLGGAILLISGATPEVHSRLSWLNDILPLPVIELSHFAGSLAGVALLFLAIGLQRRLDVAYQLTLVMLGGGVIFSLAKGLDWEEALILSLMLAALAPCHRYFYRKTSLTTEPFTPGWSVAIVIVILGTLWLGFFAYKHVEYSRELWWRFTLFGNAPRFLRTSVAAVAVALGVALRHLLRPAGPPPPPPPQGGGEHPPPPPPPGPRAHPPHRGGDRSRRPHRRRGAAHLLLSRPARRQGAALQRHRHGLRDVRRRAPELGVDGRSGGPREGARRAGLEVPRAGGPPRRLDLLLSGQRADAPPLRRPRADDGQAGRGGAGAAHRLHHRGEEPQEAAPRLAPGRRGRVHLRGDPAGGDPAPDARHRADLERLAAHQEHAREGVLARLLRPGLPQAPAARPGAQGGEDRRLRQPLAGRRERRDLDRPHAPRGRRAAGGDGLPVHRADALRLAAGVPLVQPRHGAVRRPGGALDRADVEPPGLDGLPARRALLQLPGPARLQGQVRPRLGAPLPRLPRRARLPAHPGGHRGADRAGIPGGGGEVNPPGKHRPSGAAPHHPGPLLPASPPPDGRRGPG